MNPPQVPWATQIELKSFYSTVYRGITEMLTNPQPEILNINESTAGKQERILNVNEYQALNIKY